MKISRLLEKMRSIVLKENVPFLKESLKLIYFGISLKVLGMDNLKFYIMLFCSVGQTTDTFEINRYDRAQTSPKRKD